MGADVTRPKGRDSSQSKGRGLTDQRYLNDKAFVRDQYHGYNSRYPDLDSPRDLSEKICFRKIAEQPDLIVQCTDKLAVRAFVESTIGAEYLPEVFFTSDTAADVTADRIPQAQFALKTNHDQAGVLLCPDADRFDWGAARAKMADHLARNYYEPFREMQYRGISPRVYAETLLRPKAGQAVVPDYKFFCFHGTPELIQVDMNRFNDHVRAFVTPDWDNLDIEYDDPIGRAGADRPDQLNHMLELARTLSQPFSFVRVDLYEAADRVYFGELTFTPGAGTKRFLPDSFERAMGDLWKTDLTLSIL